MSLLIVLTVVALTLVLADVLGGWLDRYDRPPMLVDMAPSVDELDVHLHLSLLDMWQRQVAASYRPVRVPDTTPRGAA